YQEILGDLHNLFGDTTAIHVALDPEHGYRIERVVEGDTVTEVLAYVQYVKQDLIRAVRGAAEQALRRGEIKMEESALLLKRYEEGLEGYTYLQRDDVPREPMMLVPPIDSVVVPQPPSPAAKDAPAPAA